MAALRHHLGGIGLALVLWQLSGVLIAPLAVQCRARAALPECCRLHGPGAVCPMDKARATASKAECRLTSASCQDDAAMASVFGVIGVLTEPESIPLPAATSAAVRTPEAAPIGRDGRPHSPPPRG